MILQNLQATITALQEFIALGSNARQMRKACSVNWFIKVTGISEIQTILYVSLGSITVWKQADEQLRVDILRLNYEGRKSYLIGQQLKEVLS